MKKITLSVKLVLLLLISGSTLQTYALKNELTDDTIVEIQQKITGTVVDNNGVALPGVNILVQGTNRGSQTDFDGKYSIEAQKGDVLVFSYVGFASQNITVGDSTTIDLTMQEDASELDEVVVVGYGTTTKRKITSSITNVNVEADLQEIPATNLSTALTGRFSGVTIAQASGKPGASSDFQIRGATSGGFAGGSAPLYVIDNVVSTKTQFDALDASEVSDVSILKDAAAAAVYGSRGANGVILVTTRTGKSGTPTINITSTYGTTDPAADLEQLNPYDTALLLNERARFNALPNAPAPENLINDTELDYLRNTNFGSFVDQLAQSAVLQRNSATISGGTDIMRYFISGSHVKESGWFENLDYEKTNFRAKVDVDVTDNLNVSLNLSTNNDIREEFYWRWNGGNESFGDFYRTGTRLGRIAPAFIDGLPVANFNGWNPGNIIQNGQGFNNRTRRNQNAIVSLTYKVPFLEGLSANLTYNRANATAGQHLARLVLTDYTFASVPGNRYELTNEVLGPRSRFDDGANTNSIVRNTNTTNTYQLNFRLNYENSFGDHDVNASAIYEEWERDFSTFSATRRGLISREVPELFATDPAIESQLSNGSSSEEGRQSVVGIVGYSYKNKYLVNGSFRADASIRFAEDSRWGYFPAVSVGWIASEENFFKDNLNFVDYFKVRYSIGETGNDAVSTQLFPYILRYSTGNGAVFGNGAISNGVFRGGEPDPAISWSTQASTNLGFDFRFLDSRLSTSVEFYKNKRRNLYGSRQEFVPESAGISLLPENYGGVDIKGVDIEVNYSDDIGDLNFNIGGRFGYTTDKLVIADIADSQRPFSNPLGQSTNRWTGYRALGIIRTQQQLDQLIADGYSFNGQTPLLGELYFDDVRGNATDDFEGVTPDGIVDGNDIEFLSNRRSPSINFGITLKLAYKGFTLEALAQGLEGHDKFTPFIGRFNPGNPGDGPWADWKDSWTFENPDASFPRYGSRNLGTNSFFLQDAGFMRLRNLSLAYDFPKDIASKIGAKNVRLFSNATNLFFIYRKIKNFDPEVQGEGIPITKSYNIGLNLTF